MAELVVNGTTYNYPDPGTEPGWGQDATDWAAAVTLLLSSLAGVGSIPETQGVVNNDQATPIQIAGLQFNSSFTFAAIIFYRIFRDTDAIDPLNETGIINIVIDNGVWKMTQEITVGEPSGVTISIDDTSGQLEYTSTNLTGLDYEGTIKFKTISIIS